ncbi:MAG TPA: iron-sulfur cluster assembly accessory protein [Planctomycetota bacterium]|nr:iron-sulfur cluster assembly accessory protein [Planctomycetota bacterium]
MSSSSPTTADVADTGIAVTERAAKEFRHILKEKGLPEDTAMRLSVKGGGCAGFAYQIDLDKNPADEFDIELHQHGLRVVVDMKSEFYMQGSTIDFNDSLMERGFKFKNPTASGTCGCGSSFSL